MRRFGGSVIGLLLTLGSVGPATGANPAVANRCVGAGNLRVELFEAYSEPGWFWTLNATGVCALSPQGPWSFVASGTGWSGYCLPNNAFTSNTAAPYSPIVVTFQMTNPRTGAERTLHTAWFFAGAPYASTVSIREAINVPSCTKWVFGDIVGRGVLVHTPDPSSILLTGDPVEMHPTAFAVQFR